MTDNSNNHSSSSDRGFPRWLPVVGIAWVGVIVLGSFLMLQHSLESGMSGDAPHQWPADLDLKPDRDMPVVVMAVHPECSCTEASLEQVERIMTRRSNELCVVMLFYQSSNLKTDLQESATWKRASANPGIRPVLDPDGLIAERFGAETSGDVLFYDASLKLRFHGGLTASRGDYMAGTGSDAILNLLQGVTTTNRSAPVFGCAIQDSL